MNIRITSAFAAAAVLVVGAGFASHAAGTSPLLTASGSQTPSPTGSPDCPTALPRLGPETFNGHSSASLSDLCAADSKTARGTLTFESTTDLAGPQNYRVRVRYVYEGFAYDDYKPWDIARYGYTDEVYVSDVTYGQVVTVPFEINLPGIVSGEQRPGTGVEIVAVEHVPVGGPVRLGDVPGAPVPPPYVPSS